MKHSITKIIVLFVLLSAASISVAATEDQHQVRAQMARFWGIAEQRVLETPLPDAAVAADAPSYSWSSRSCRPPQRSIDPSRTVQMRQQANSSSSRSGVGLTLFGGLRIFDITWSDEKAASNDELQGNL